MTHEKIFKNTDGSKIKVYVSIYTSILNVRTIWNVTIWYCAPAKRKYAIIDRSNDFYPIDEQILAAKLELWEKLKPTI